MAAAPPPSQPAAGPPKPRGGRCAGCAAAAPHVAVAAAAALAAAFASTRPFRLALSDVRPRAVPLSATEFHHPLEVNTLLRDGVEHVAAGAAAGVETAVAQPGTGDVFGFDEYGWLLRVPAGVHAGSAPPERVMHVGGRVLGAAFNWSAAWGGADAAAAAAARPPTVILGADAARGLVAVDVAARTVTVLASASDDGVPILFADDLDVSPDGTVYLSDATDAAPWQAGPGAWPAVGELAERDFHRGTGAGRLLAYHPGNRSVTTVLSGLYFANGVAVSADGSFVLVAETLNGRILRAWRTGKRAGSSEVFVELPALPDGLSRAADGGFYVSCPTVVQPLHALAAGSTVLRAVVGMLPPPLWPPKPAVGIVIKLHSNGAPAYALHDPDGSRVSFVTAVTEVVESWPGGPGAPPVGWLWLGQLKGTSMPRVRIPQTRDFAGGG
jgi:sugar lactone lactonase YvrE